MQVKHPYWVLKQFCVDLIGYDGVYAFQTPYASMLNRFISVTRLGRLILSSFAA